MPKRIFSHWLAPALLLVVCGGALAHTFLSNPSPQPVTTESVVAHKPASRGATAFPKIDPTQPGASEWVTYPADDVLPYGISIEVCDGVIIGVATKDPESPNYDILFTRYVIGDVDATDVTMPLWRVLDLEMTKPDGSVAELSVGRPLWWITETQATVGDTIDLGLHEIGISGDAKVLRISPSTSDSRDNPEGTNIVTGKIKHENAVVYDLAFNGNSDDPLGVTANHPIYSFDRDDWVPAGELKLDEQVSTVDGTAKLTSKKRRPGLHTVYNMEVHRAHSYHVSQLGILAHNSNVLNCFKISKVAPDWSTKGFHVHVNGVELALRPGHSGSIVLKKVFSSTKDSAFNAASRKMQRALSNTGVRAKLHRDAVRARDYLKGLGDAQSIAKSGELTFLIKALEKMGI